MRRSSWHGFGTVLCAVDFSDPSRRALRHAAAVAARGDGRLVVVFVNDPLLVGAAAVSRPRLDLRAEGRRSLGRFVRTTLGGTFRLPVECRVTTGEATEQILAMAQSVRAGLIVIGSKGLTGIPRLTFGSTAVAVLRNARMPVLVIPSHGRTARRRFVSWPRGSVVAPVMLHSQVGRDVDAALRIAEWFGCSMLVTHVVDVPVLPTWLRRRIAARGTNELARARQRLTRAVASSRRVPTRLRVVQGHLAETVAAIAQRERAPLLITMLRDRHDWFDAARGALTYRMLTEAGVPVLGCPPRWRPR
jgi:nucleotide-binding universal stress UspA family protein